MIESGPNATFGDHINKYELQAALNAVLAATPLSRLLLITDSSVAYGILCKGRSASQPLLRIARRLAAIMVLTRVMLLPKWVPSHVNPSDAPSRVLYDHDV